MTRQRHCTHPSEATRANSSATPSLPFTSTLAVTENPASLGGALVNTASIYSYHLTTRITSGKLYGTGPSDAENFRDCPVRTSASLGISTTKHYCKAIVHRTGGYTAPNAQEVELVCMVSDTPTSLKLYEFLWGFDSGRGMVRWNGTGGDYTFHGDAGWTDTPIVNIGCPNLEHGDVVEMFVELISGSPRITVKHEGTTFLQVDDTSAGKLTSGQPGWSFFAREGSGLDMAGYCFSYIEAGNWS
jgi:hypothetical protein